MPQDRPDEGYPAAPVPAVLTPEALRRGASACRACELFEPATQVVVGEGPVEARVMLVGEQPGDREDLAGRPFVGPAGRILAEGLERAGIARSEVYLTNAVKHFRYKLRGRRRIHQTPDRWQVQACLPWLHAEIELVAPEAIVCLGATAGQALLGPSLRVGRDRGQALDSPLAPLVTVTAHPSSVLRLRDQGEREAGILALAEDLATVKEFLAGR